MKPAVARDLPSRLERQASFCTVMGAALYGTVLRALAADYRSGGPVYELFDADDELAGRSSIGLRLMAALHFDALTGFATKLAARFPSCGGDGDAERASHDAIAWVGARAAHVAVRCNATPQTNEVARSMPLLGGVLTVAAKTGLPVRLYDIGSSAGLNARLDRYRYAGNGWQWGDAHSPLLLRNHAKAGMPRHLDARLEIADRGACDLHPLDIGSEHDRTTLRSYVWADQLERFERLDRAMQAASSEPMAVERADLFEWIPRRAAPAPGTTAVVMQSVVSNHLSPSGRERLVATIERLASMATNDGPFAWLRMEDEGAAFVTRVTLWPGARETTIATSDGHGQSLAWVDS
ncbi:MAG: DUF2332 domain-containing protein [Candidatus Eremiobacteraeota bacterium]|nr:DUF2332 domain-containing protein [Candidatus Eremiobacteraeota bacterium]